VIYSIPKGRETAVLGRVLGAISTLSPETAWDIEIRERKSRRTDQQNRYLWGVCYAHILKVGGETLAGWTAEDLHEYFLGEHFGWEHLRGFGRVRLRPVRRSSRLSKMEFADYIGFIQRKAAELGIVIPDPQEYLKP
jgi:hypothetical protein